MGDRANVRVVGWAGKSSVHLYTHWGGTELPWVVQTAMRRKLRWDDCAYLTRIIFCEMVKGEESEETGFGISQARGDGGNRVLVVDTDECMVSIGDMSWSFPAFCELDLDKDRAFRKAWHLYDEED